jgi:hypothetical protein
MEGNARGTTEAAAGTFDGFRRPRMKSRPRDGIRMSADPVTGLPFLLNGCQAAPDSSPNEAIRGRPGSFYWGPLMRRAGFTQ